jgi:glutathione S-transferase
LKPSWQTPYLLGDDFSVADAYLFTCLNWAHMVHRSLEDFPAISAFMNRVHALPAVQAALKDEACCAEPTAAIHYARNCCGRFVLIWQCGFT